MSNLIFCEKCGKLMNRDVNKVLRCINGHQVRDDVYIDYQKRLKERKEKERVCKQEILDEIIKIHYKDYTIFKFNHPYMERQKEAGSWTPNADTIPFYTKLIPRLEKKYKPYEFYRRKGKKNGKKEEKDGFFVIRKDKVAEIKIEVENSIDGSGFTLELMNLEEGILKSIIDEIVKEMREKFKEEDK